MDETNSVKVLIETLKAVVGSADALDEPTMKLLQTASQVALSEHFIEAAVDFAYRAIWSAAENGNAAAIQSADDNMQNILESIKKDEGWRANPEAAAAVLSGTLDIATYAPGFPLLVQRLRDWAACVEEVFVRGGESGPAIANTVLKAALERFYDDGTEPYRVIENLQSRLGAVGVPQA